MSGKVVHFEIPYDDGDRARGFYKEAFGWDLQSWGDGSYTLVSTGPTGETGPTETGFINGGMMKREGFFSAPVVTVAVDDIDEVLTAIGRLGGKTVQERMPVGDMGFSAYFQDPEGNVIGLFQMA
ncbi:MAG TPA: VOC family protein [Nocardioidaceae bacterium]|nr:VOC family protein [Nocardioidaceae bacterium]